MSKNNKKEHQKIITVQRTFEANTAKTVSD